MELIAESSNQEEIREALTGLENDSNNQEEEDNGLNDLALVVASEKEFH